ncbi:hypothetical protein L914_00712, partial [Phytophthora nicotianae]
MDDGVQALLQVIEPKTTGLEVSRHPVCGNPNITERWRGVGELSSAVVVRSMQERGRRLFSVVACRGHLAAETALVFTSEAVGSSQVR